MQNQAEVGKTASARVDAKGIVPGVLCMAAMQSYYFRKIGQRNAHPENNKAEQGAKNNVWK
jgi:hypothetical protein